MQLTKRLITRTCLYDVDSFELPDGFRFLTAYRQGTDVRVVFEVADTTRVAPFDYALVYEMSDVPAGYKFAALVPPDGLGHGFVCVYRKIGFDDLLGLS